MLFDNFLQRLLSEISALDSGVQSLREAASNLLCDGSESGRVAVARLLTAIDRRLSRLNSRAQVLKRHCLSFVVNLLNR